MKYHLSTRNDFNIIGEASTLGEAMNIIDLLQPDIAVVDLFLNEESGIDLLKHYKIHPTRTKIIALSSHNDQVYLDRCLEYDAQAFVLKSDSGQEFLKAIDEVVSGEFYLSQTMSNRMVNHLLITKAAPTHASEIKITRREIEILNQINKGCSTSQIAVKLQISHRTVETHRTNLFKKLLVKNSIELINKAKHLAIIE